MTTLNNKYTVYILKRLESNKQIIIEDHYHCTIAEILSNACAYISKSLTPMIGPSFSSVLVRPRRAKKEKRPCAAAKMSRYGVKIH